MTRRAESIDHAKLVLNSFCYLLREELMRFPGKWATTAAANISVLTQTSFPAKEYDAIQTLADVRVSGLKACASRMAANILQHLENCPVAFTAEVPVPKNGGLVLRRIIPEPPISVLMEIGASISFSVLIAGEI